MVEEQFRSLPGRGEFSKGDEMGQLTKSIYEGEDDGVALGCRQTSHKVQRDATRDDGGWARGAGSRQVGGERSYSGYKQDRR